jgi:protein required for attachment to host cells
VVAEDRKAHVYKRTPAGVMRMPDADICCSEPFPENIAGERQGFLQALAGWLNAAEREAAFDRLVLIARQDILDELRELLDARVVARLCGALQRELAQVSEEEVEDHLTEVCWL